jgi:arginine repressor
MTTAYFPKITIPGNEIERQIDKIDSELEEAKSALAFYENEEDLTKLPERLMELMFESLDVVQATVTLLHMEGQQELIERALDAHIAKIKYYALKRGWEIK